MTSLSEKELSKKAEKLFAKVASNELFATTDGQFFYAKGDAHSHAGPKGNVYTFLKSSYEQKVDEKKKVGPTVKELTETVSQIEDVQQLNKMLEEETARQRATAIKAISARIEELSKPD